MNYAPLGQAHFTFTFRGANLHLWPLSTLTLLTASGQIVKSEQGERFPLPSLPVRHSALEIFC